MALPTNGRVVLETTAGDIEIEMWSKASMFSCNLQTAQQTDTHNFIQEAPKACRNFIALAMEGYYDGVIFHRIVKDFLIQTGDRTGSGGGGETFYGEPFADEIHPRLKFVHRGLVGCANNGEKNSNDSQFFITLDRADELNGKHTLWGRCVGDTFFNALKIGQSEVGKDERPIYPPKIKTVKILENPFDDIVPRITAAEKRAQQKAREAAQKEREEAAKRKGAKKNTALLSFGMAEGTVEDAEPVTFKKKPIVRPDLIDDPSIAAAILPPAIADEPPKSKKGKAKAELPMEVEKPAASTSTKEEDVLAIRQKHKKEKDSVKTTREQEIAKMEEDIRKLSRRRDDSDSETERAAKRPKGPSAYQLEIAKYKKGKPAAKKGKKDESDILAALSSFRSKLRGAGDDDGDEGSGAPPEPEATEGVEVDDDREWLNHRLHFAKENDEVNQQAQDHYEVIDPRARGKKAVEEERARKQERRGGPSKVFRASDRR